MKTLNDLENIRYGQHALVIGSAASIKEHKNKIDEFIKKVQPFIIGINNMTHLFVPDYHAFTNSQRFRTYGINIKPCSQLLLGQNIPLKLINKVIGNRDYTLINYTDKEGVPINYKNGKITGFFRTCGNLSLMLAYIMGADQIYFAGIDGYSMYSKSDLEAGIKTQHSYGVGLTDTADYETCVKKDKLIGKSLQLIKDYGIDFKIITPTIYKNLYDKTILNI